LQSTWWSWLAVVRETLVFCNVLPRDIEQCAENGDALPHVFAQPPAFKRFSKQRAATADDEKAAAAHSPVAEAHTTSAAPRRDRAPPPPPLLLLLLLAALRRCRSNRCGTIWQRHTRAPLQYSSAL
jgi:hypothetical protein